MDDSSSQADATGAAEQGERGTEVERDPQTGALSKRHFLELLAHELELGRREERTVALAHLELDGVVTHDAPRTQALQRACLAQFGRFLRDQARVGESLGRGPESLYRWLMPGATLEEALFRVEEMRRLLSSATVRVPFEGGAATVQTSLRAGVAASPRDGETARDLSRSAEGALHRAWRSHTPVALASRERMVLKSNFYPRSQLDRLAFLAQRLGSPESVLLREALDDLLDQHRDGDLALGSRRPVPADRGERAR